MANDPTIENLGGDKEGKANLFLVDPNPPGRDVIPSEDLFMYVKLSATKRNRSVIEIGENNAKSFNSNITDGVINFIATSVNKDSTNQTLTNNGNSYATTDWTNIGGKINEDSSGILEGFGINSINISYGASLVPKVDITFTDLRGASLFNVMDKNNRKSPYSVFFSMPYPVFELTVKGYFGKSVTYCLHLVKSNFDFDGSTGNFQIKANFLGFQQAFLADMVLGNIIGVVNTRSGADALSKLTIKDKFGDEKPTPKIDDFINEVSKISQLTEELKQDKTSKFESLKVLNTELSKLRRLRSFLGKPILNTTQSNILQNQIDNGAIESGGKAKEKASKELVSDNIGYDGLVDGVDYTIINDMLVVKYSRVTSFLDFATKAQSLYTDYSDFQQSKNVPLTLKNSPFKTIGTGTDSKVEPNNLFYGDLIKQDPEDNFISLYQDSFLPDNGVLNKLTNWGSTFDFNSLVEQRGNYFGAGKFTNNGDDKVFALDLWVARNEIEIDFIEKKSKIDKLQEEALKELNEKLSKKLTFNPTIRDVFSIFTNNTQAMLMALHDVSIKAENKKVERLTALNKKLTEKISESSDVPENAKGIYAWPEIIQTQTDNKKENQWIGDIIPVDSEDAYLFPEISFIEDVADGYLTSTNRINSGSESASKGTVKSVNENWYPVSPFDYSISPYSDLNKPSKWDIKTPGGIPESLIEEILDRVIFLTNTSKFNKNLKYYSRLDGAYAGINTKDRTYAEIIIDSKLNSTILLEYAKDKNLIKPVSGTSEWFKDNITLGSFKIDGKTTCRSSYLYIDEDKSDTTGSSIINNLLGVSENITQTESPNTKKAIEEINKSYPTNDIDKGIRYFDSGYKLPTHIISYLVWGEDIKNKLKTDGIKNDQINYILSFNNINDIDGEANNGQSDNKYLGVLDTERKLTQTPFYSGQTDDMSRALLLLNTLPFDNPINKVIPLLGDVAKVVKIPKYYLLWICGSIWRYKKSNGILSNDPISWTDPTIPQVSPSSFLYSVGVNKIYDKTTSLGKNIPNLLLTLPAKTEEKLINYYEEWVQNEFGEFNRLMGSYMDSVGVNTQEGKYASDVNSLLNIIKQQVRVVSTNPNIWTETLRGNVFNTQDVTTYLDTFNESFRGFWVAGDVTRKSSSENDDGENSDIATTNNSNIKNALYIYFKNVYDKWVAGTVNGKDMFNACAPSIDDNLIDYFKFISRSWCDIGDSAVVNLNSVATLSGDYDINMYFYLAKVLRDSNFLLQILPTYINFKDDEEVKDIFRPITNVNSNGKSSGPIYTCIYAGGNSKTLDIEDGNYTNDGFNMKSNQVPEEFTSCSKPLDGNDDTYNLVAFRVAFGGENQTIFKNLNLNQEEHRETGEYFKVLADTFDKKGGTKRSYQGTDLYQIYQTRSYKCKVDALGCMNIQPLMYFQLDNVPFFNGAYLITNVTHNITPNHITTNFEGVRQSKVTTPIVDTATTFLNLNLTEEFEQSKIDLTPVNRNPAPFGVASPNDSFNFATLSIEQFKRLGVQQDIAQTLTTADGTGGKFQEILSRFEISTNAEVVMFLSQALYESSNMTILEEVWNNPTPNSGGTAQYGSTEQLAYEKPNNKLGNTQTGDGYKFRGRGMFLLTGRDEYTDLKSDTKFIDNLDISGDLFDNLAVISNDPLVALASACSFWKRHNINNMVSGGEFKDGKNPLDKFTTTKAKNKYNAGTSAAFMVVSEEITPKDYKHSDKRLEVFAKVVNLLNLKDDFNL